MQIKNSKVIKKIIEKSPDMMNVLKIVKGLNLKDWWIGAGFIRNRIWDMLHNFTENTPYNDIDVIYFDKENTEETNDYMLEKKLNDICPDLYFNIRNQARMHLKNNNKPYKSIRDAISRWPEKATAIAVKLDKKDKVKICAPYGIKQLIKLEVHPTKYFKENLEIYKKRIINKKWTSIWEKLKIYEK